jgi:hypothetical protein
MVCLFGVLFENLQVHAQNPVEGNCFLDRYGDAVAWGGCTILYLLGQQLRFELLDFTYHVLSVAEAEALPSAQLSLAEKSKSSYPSLVKKFHKLLCLSPLNTSMPKCVPMHIYSFENLFIKIINNYGNN